MSCDVRVFAAGVLRQCADLLDGPLRRIEHDYDTALAEPDGMCVECYCECGVNTSRDPDSCPHTEDHVRVERDELLVQRDELRAEVAVLQGQLHDAAIALNQQLDIVHELDEELARLRGGVR